MKKFMQKKAVRVIAVLLAVILVIGGSATGYYFGFMNPYRGMAAKQETSLELDGVLTKKQATDDLKYIYNKLKGHHPAWIEKDSPIPDKVKQQYETELAGFGESITVLQLWQAAARVTAVMHDGHTSVQWNNPGEYRYIDDFTFLKEHGVPLSINGIAISEVMEAYKKSCSYEMEAYAERTFYNTQIVEESALRKCGVDTANGVEMTFLTEQGQVSKHFNFVTLDQVKGADKPSGEQKWVYYTIDKEKSLGIFTLKQCVVNDEYRKVLDEFFTEVFNEGIKNIAVDLRGDGGGSSGVANDFLHYIDVDSYKQWQSDLRYGFYMKTIPAMTIKNNKKGTVFKGKLFVATDVRSFSAAMDFAMIVGDNNLGEIVGEASGNLPDSYIDWAPFQTPNAKLPFIISLKRCYRIDASKSGQPITPHHEVPPEQALEKIYELIG